MNFSNQNQNQSDQQQDLIEDSHSDYEEPNFNPEQSIDNRDEENQRNHQNDSYIDNSRTNIIVKNQASPNLDNGRDEFLDEENFDDDDESFGQQSMYSHIASQHPLSFDEEQIPMTEGSDDSDEHIINKLEVSRKELAPLCLFQVCYLAVIILPPLLLYEDCRNSPHFVSHIIIAVLLLILVILSTYYHKKKLKSSSTSDEASAFSLMKSQGRCCREIISLMKLIDTYTNICFFSLVLHQKDTLPSYVFAITIISCAIYLVFKFILTLYFIIFVILKLRQSPQKNEEKPDKQLLKQQKLNQKKLMKLLIWLDQDTMSKLYDPDGDSTESKDYLYHRSRYSYVKIIVEDFPLAAIQAVYLSQEFCSKGLNSVIIVSLYFNSVCILYGLSNLCSSKGNEGDSTRVYKKESERLRDYYNGNQIRVIAEFYIEDQEEIQVAKIRALNDYLASYEYDVSSFNFSTNLLGEETINYLHEIIVNSSETLDDLTLSRCKLKSNHLSFFFFPQGLIKLNLSENRIGDAGAKLLSNYILEKNKQNLLTLNLEHNNISINGAQTLMKAIQQSSIIHFNLRKNRLNSTEELPDLQFILDVYKCLQINFLRYLNLRITQGLKLLETYQVKLTNNEILDRVLQSLFRIDGQPTIKSMDLNMRFFMQSRTKKKDKGLGLQYYSDDQRLILFAIHYNANIQKHLPQLDLDMLHQLNPFTFQTSLLSLNLSSNWFSTKAQHLLCTSIYNFINLKELYYNNNTLKNPSGFFKALSSCSLLEVIFLKSCQFLGDYQIDFRECLNQLPELQIINFNYSDIQDQTVQSLALCLPSLKKIAKINLKQCGLTKDSVDLIFDNLSSSSSILSLNLSQNDLQGILHLGKFIKSSKTIERIKLQKTQLGDNELKQISYGLKINKSLQYLDLSQNQIQNVGEIKDGLSCNIGLEKLDISNNQIDNDGLIKLSECLLTNACLETLSISFNQYQLEGIKEFLKIFETNETLSNVSFSIPPNMPEQDYQTIGDLMTQTLKTMSGYFKKLEILGAVKKLKEDNFFFNFIKEGTFNVEELIFDDILKKQQLSEIVKALTQIVAGPQNQQELEFFNKHKLKRITFVKPQEFSEEIQQLENLLEEKANLVFLPHQLREESIVIQEEVKEQIQVKGDEKYQEQVDEDDDMASAFNESEQSHRGNIEQQMRLQANTAASAKMGKNFQREAKALQQLE